MHLCPTCKRRATQDCAVFHTLVEDNADVVGEQATGRNVVEAATSTGRIGHLREEDMEVEAMLAGTLEDTPADLYTAPDTHLDTMPDTLPRAIWDTQTDPGDEGRELAKTRR